MWRLNLFPFFIHRIKRDTIPLLLFVIVCLIMTYPLIFRMYDIPFRNPDTYHAMWQNWWTWEAIQAGIDYNFTPMMFAPNGIDMTTLPPRWTNMLLWIPIYELFGDPFAYNLTLIFGMILRAYGMYLFCLWLFKNRISAWVAGAFYAFAAISLQLGLQQPLTGSTEFIPFFMLVVCLWHTADKTQVEVQQRLLD